LDGIGQCDVVREAESNVHVIRCRAGRQESAADGTRLVAEDRTEVGIELGWQLGGAGARPLGGL